ncbi:MAG TPA: hypothetical protein VES20_14130 [Bryobacteraceae bacterium]|nr:hypothetical protein [Bryobacteraceae bacterium]
MRPTATKAVTAKDALAVFDNVAANPAYGKPKPATMNSDRRASIELKLDDSIKVP